MFYRVFCIYSQSTRKQFKGYLERKTLKMWLHVVTFLERSIVGSGGIFSEFPSVQFSTYLYFKENGNGSWEGWNLCCVTLGITIWRKLFWKSAHVPILKKKRDVSGRTPSSVANDAVDKTKRWGLRTSLLTQPRAMELMHLTTIAGAPCLYFFSWKNMPNA